MSRFEALLVVEIRQYLQDVPPEVLIDCVVDASMQEEAVFEELDRFALTDPTKIRIFIRGLNYDTTKESLAKAFERFGPVVDATVIYDKIAKRSKGDSFYILSTFRTLFFSLFLFLLVS